MNTQIDCDFVVATTSDDMTASYVPVCFDQYLCNARMQHAGARADTKNKIHSDYDLPTSFIFLRNLDIKHFYTPLVQH
jgi:hypothetical protein